MGRDELGCQKWRKTRTPAYPSQRKRALEVISRRLEGIVRGEFIDSLHGIDELRNRWWSLKVRYALSLHDVLDGVLVLDEGDDAAKRWERHSPEWLGINAQAGDSFGYEVQFTFRK